MKSKNSAIAMLIIGLLLAATFPVSSRLLGIPDFLTGFMVGIGIVLEIFAIVQLVSRKKSLSKTGK